MFRNISLLFHLLRNHLSVFHFFDRTEKDNLKRELSAQLAKATDIHKDYSPLEWLKGNASTHTCWSAAARKVLLIQPSPAAAEQVFSILKSSFGINKILCYKTT